MSQNKLNELRIFANQAERTVGEAQAKVHNSLQFLSEMKSLQVIALHDEKRDMSEQEERCHRGLVKDIETLERMLTAAKTALSELY